MGADQDNFLNHKAAARQRHDRAAVVTFSIMQLLRDLAGDVNAQFDAVADLVNDELRAVEQQVLADIPD